MDSYARGVGRQVLVIALTLCLGPAPAAAQRVVLSYSPQLFVAPPVTESWHLGTGVLEWRRPGLLASGGVFTSDGHYLVAPVVTGGPPAFTVTDAVTGAIATVPLAFWPIAAHPRATAVFGLMRRANGAGADAARLDGGGLTIYEGCVAGTTQHLDVAVDGQHLLVVCTSGELVVLDALSGAERRRVSVAATGQARQVASNHDGSRAVVVRGANASSGDIAVMDTVTGAAIATTVFPGASTPPLPGDCVSGALAGASPDRGQLVIACTWVYSDPLGGPTTFTVASRLLDATTLGWGPDLGVRYYPHTVAISPDNRQALTLSTHPRGFSVYQRIALPAATTTAELAPSAALGLAVAFAPLAPTLTASVAGRTAALHWTLPAHSPSALGYVLEIGTAPGLTNLGAITLGAATDLTVPGVPAGTYFVRLRAGNTAGPGPASNEITVVVP